MCAGSDLTVEVVGCMCEEYISSIIVLILFLFLFFFSFTFLGPHFYLYFTFLTPPCLIFHTPLMSLSPFPYLYCLLHERNVRWLGF